MGKHFQEFGIRQANSKSGLAYNFSISDEVTL